MHHLVNLCIYTKMENEQLDLASLIKECFVVKDCQLLEKDMLLKDKDKQLAEKDRQLIEKCEQLAEKDKQLTAIIAQKDEELADLRRQLNEIVQASLKHQAEGVGEIVEKVTSLLSGYEKSISCSL